MFINIRERRREIGTLLAIGVTPKTIITIFLGKAVFPGLIGGLSGTFIAVLLGPRLAGVTVAPIPEWPAWAVIIAVVFSAISSIVPANHASNLDPAIILQEE